MIYIFGMIHNMKLCAKELRISEPDPEVIAKIKKNPIYIICDNVLDTYNIGAIFRLADAVAAEKVYLCGQTETPPNSRIKKASIGTWKWVEWEHTPTAVEAIQNLIRQYGGQNLKTIAIEQDSRSVPYDEFDYSYPIALVIGNETTGVSREVLDLCDAIVELPMFGINISLNVMVSLGIVLYEVIEKNKLK